MGYITSIDQLGTSLEILFPPVRIISLVPSQTEYLFDLGLEEQIAGVTRFCVHPELLIDGKPKIGGTKAFDFQQIDDLRPDLIIGNKEENYLEGIENLRRRYPVWMSDIHNLEDAFGMMEEIGRITYREAESQQILGQIRKGFGDFRPTNTNRPSVAYFIWRRPYMVAASGTFIDHMLKKLGLKNVFGDLNRYPEIKPETIALRKPEFIFLSSEPYSFSQRHFEEFQSFYTGSKVLLVDGEMFSWYGSRLKSVPDYFTRLWEDLLNK